LQFNDASQFIHAPSATVLDINATDEIELNATLIDVNGNLDVSGTITLGSGAVISEAELEMLDGITAGTVAASKAVVVDANKDASSFRNLTATGAVTAGSLVIGSADIAEAELEMLDGITAGTAAASKAMVLDSAKDISGGRNLTISGELDAVSLDISGDIDVDGTANLDIVDIDGAVDMASTLGVTGVVTANAGVVVDNFTLDGTTLALSSGDMTLDSAAGIILDAGDGTIALHEAGNGVFGTFTRASGSLAIKSEVSDADIIFKGNDGGAGITAMTIDMSAGGNVGIGTAAPDTKLVVANGNDTLKFNLDNDSIDFFASGKTFNLGTTSNSVVRFFSNNTERMRIAANGDFFIGTTNGNPTGNHVPGLLITAGGQINAHRDGGNPLRVGTDTDGNLTEFYKQGALLGSIGNSNGSSPGDLFICSSTSGHAGLGFGGGPSINPTNNAGALSDNTVSLGLSSHRFDDAFITNGVTTGSDRNEKQDIVSLTSTEMLVAARLSKTFHTYRWKDAVVDKGNDARIHTGTIAQEVQAAFTAESLDASNYAMFMSDTWWEHDVKVPAVEAVAEVTDEDGNVTTEAVKAVDAYTRTDTYDTEDEAPSGSTSRTRLGIRYPELLSFLAAYNEQRFATIETRLTALENA